MGLGRYSPEQLPAASPQSARVGEIREREEKATPAPWLRDGTLWVNDHTEIDLRSEREDVDGGYPDWYTIKSERAEEDAEFIANARSDIPFLLDYIASLEARVSQAETDSRLLDELERLAWDDRIGVYLIDRPIIEVWSAPKGYCAGNVETRYHSFREAAAASLSNTGDSPNTAGNDL